MFLDFRSHIICILIASFILIHYSKRLNLNLESTKSFKKLSIAAIISFLFSGITEYTVNNRDIVSGPLNNILHTIFFISVILTCQYVFDYISSYIYTNKPNHSTTGKKLRTIFLIISLLGIEFLPIEYVDAEFTSYSYGPKVYFLYFSVLLIIGTEIISLTHNRNYIPKKLYNALKNGLAVFFMMSFIQLMVPYLLVSNIGIILEIIILYISLEEPDKYIDTDTETFNIDALRLVLKEQIYLNTGKNLYLYYTSEKLTKEHIEQIEAQLSVYFKKRHYIYKISERTFGIISSKRPGFNSNIIMDNGIINIVTMPSIVDGINTFIKKNTHDELYVDKMTNVFNRNKYELDIKNQINNEDLWYIIVDLNNLKTTNDTLGHDKGDELIKDLVKLLRENFTQEPIYRFGGDEFVILSKDKDITNKIDELKAKSAKFNEINKKELEFALGFAQYIHSESDWDTVVQNADKEMYINKKEIKSRKQALV